MACLPLPIFRFLCFPYLLLPKTLYLFHKTWDFRAFSMVECQFSCTPSCMTVSTDNNFMLFSCQGPFFFCYLLHFCSPDPNFVLSLSVFWGYSVTSNNLQLVVSVVHVWLLAFWIFQKGLLLPKSSCFHFFQLLQAFHHKATYAQLHFDAQYASSFFLLIAT